MKWENKILYVVCFFAGAFVSYLTLQFSFFDTKTELDVPNIILSVVTLLIGLFIAVTIQKKVNKSQNQHTYLIGKLDILWSAFNDFSQEILYDTKIDISSIRKLMKDVIHPMSFLKNIFASFHIDYNCITLLEEKLEQLESILSNIPAENNVVDFSNELSVVQVSILDINKYFSEILKEIQEL